jgi:hypothetical protein
MMKLLTDALITELRDDALLTDDFTNFPTCVTSVW